MNFKIVEQFIEGKMSAKKCEDRIVITSDFVVVIDGATSKSNLSFGAYSTGQMAVIILEKAIKKMPKKLSVEGAIAFLTRSIMSFYEENKLVERAKKNPPDRLIASIAIYSYYYNEIWLVGDCQCMVGKKSYNNKALVDEVLSNTRALYLETELLKGKSLKDLKMNDTGRAYILPLLKKQMGFRNSSLQSDFSYSALDGFLPNMDKIKIIKVDDVSIVLASDGYPKLYDTLKDSEEYLKYIIEKDALCFRLFKSTKGMTEGSKSFDDRSYIKFNIISDKSNT